VAALAPVLLRGALVIGLRSALLLTRRAQSAYCALFLRYVPAGAKRAAFTRALAGAVGGALLFLAIVFLLMPRTHPRPRVLSLRMRARSPAR
jgi:hypothetical protein